MCVGAAGKKLGKRGDDGTVQCGLEKEGSVVFSQGSGN